MCRVLATTLLLVVLIVTVVSNNSNSRCLNGVLERGRCICKDDYIGEQCEKRMHCSTYMRNDDLTCKECQEGWMGSHCEFIICDSKHGKRTADALMCECTEPATGEHCGIFTTENILLHYNKGMADFWVPVGALVILPMVACFLLCEHFAERRQVKRIEQTLGDKTFTDDGSEVILDLYSSTFTI